MQSQEMPSFPTKKMPGYAAAAAPPIFNLGGSISPSLQNAGLQELSMLPDFSQQLTAEKTDQPQQAISLQTQRPCPSVSLSMNSEHTSSRATTAPQILTCPGPAAGSNQGPPQLQKFQGSRKVDFLAQGTDVSDSNTLISSNEWSEKCEGTLHASCVDTSTAPQLHHSQQQHQQHKQQQQHVPPLQSLVPSQNKHSSMQTVDHQDPPHLHPTQLGRSHMQQEQHTSMGKMQQQLKKHQRHEDRRQERLYDQKQTLERHQLNQQHQQQALQLLQRQGDSRAARGQATTGKKGNQSLGQVRRCLGEQYLVNTNWRRSLVGRAADLETPIAARIFLA